MSELQAGIPYAGKPTEAYTAYNSNKKPYIAIRMHVTHQAHEGRWLDVGPKPDGSEHVAWIRWYISDAAWPYTADKLRALQFNGDFSNPAFGGESVTIQATQNGKYLKWDTPSTGQSERDPISQVEAHKFTARYRMNNPAPQPQAAPAANPPAPEAQPTPPPAATTSPPPVADDGEAIPF